MRRKQEKFDRHARETQAALRNQGRKKHKPGPALTPEEIDQLNKVKPNVEPN